MVTQCHLVLFFGLVEVTIKHLEDGIFGVDLSVVVLLVDADLLFELLGLGETEKLSPMGQDLHTIELCIVRFFNHVSLELGSSLLEQLLLFLEIFDRLVDISDFNLSSF